MTDEITGNFDFAIQELISRLVRAQQIPGLASFAENLLFHWDFNRGTDWYTSTKLVEQQRKEHDRH